MYNVSSVDPFSSTSSLYGPGALLGWFLTAVSTMPSGKFDANFFVTMTLPYVASSHAIYQALQFHQTDWSACAAGGTTQLQALVALFETSSAAHWVSVLSGTLCGLRLQRWSSQALALAGIAVLDLAAQLVGVRMVWSSPGLPSSCAACDSATLFPELCKVISDRDLWHTALFFAFLVLFAMNLPFVHAWDLRLAVLLVSVIGQLWVWQTPHSKMKLGVGELFTLPRTPYRLSDLDQAVAAFAGASVLASSAVSLIGRSVKRRKKVERTIEEGDTELDMVLPLRDLFRDSTQDYGTV